MKKISFLAGLIVILSLYAVSAMAYDSAPVGWASENGGTTGGAGGTVVEVNNATDFIEYVQNKNQDPYIIYVSGNIDLGSSNVRVRGNKTIIGLPGSHISGNLKCYNSEESNNIFRFLDMDNKADVGDGDCISIDGVQHIWIDHCTFTDGGDGNVDIKNGADYVTVSWCIFKYTYDSGHNFSNLIGHDDGNGGTDANHLLVTFHHNWYSTLCKERMPRVRFGRVHVFNNYYDCAGNNYCIGVGNNCNIRVESNYFNSVTLPWKDYRTNGAGIIGWDSNNVFVNTTIPIWAPNDYATVFTPPYSYTPDNPADIPALVQYGAGADGKDGTPPHWYYGFYGDFDKSGFVDMNDFAAFANYWGVSDCNQLFNADYNGDCKVDFYELGLLVENWLYIPPDITPPAIPTGLSATAGNATVSLDWDDNTEPDFAGYNIYRSTTSGSGYSKFNTSLLSSSNYTDNNVVNETAYYYVVTATDTNANESDYSSEVLAYPSAGSSSVTIQENTAGFCDVDGAVESEYSGWTGTGYANTVNATGNGIDYSVNILTAGTYTFTWRYASTSSRPANLIIDSSTISSISFPSSGAFSTWATETVSDVNLTAGVKTIRLQATGSGGLANIDYMNVAGVNLMPASCP